MELSAPGGDHCLGVHLCTSSKGFVKSINTRGKGLFPLLRTSLTLGKSSLRTLEKRAMARSRPSTKKNSGPLMGMVTPGGLGERRKCPVEEVGAPYSRALIPAKRGPYFGRLQDGGLPAYDPDGSDLCAWVLAPIKEWGNRRRLLYSLVTNQVWDIAMEPSPRQLRKVDDRLRNSPLRHIFRRAGNEAADRVTLGQLMDLPDVRHRLRSILAIMEPIGEDTRPTLFFDPDITKTALETLRPSKHYWEDRGMTNHWVDFDHRVVFSKHPTKEEVVTGTDLGDPLIQAFFQCTGLMLTGSKGGQPDHSVLQPAPAYAVTRHFDTRKYADMKVTTTGDAYLKWAAFWHSPPERPNFKVHVNLESAGWTQDRGHEAYRLPRLPGKEEELLAWYLDYIATLVFPDHQYLPARYQEFYPAEEVGRNHAFAIREECKRSTGVEEAPSAKEELKEWHEYPVGTIWEDPLDEEVFLGDFARLCAPVKMWMRKRYPSTTPSLNPTVDEETSDETPPPTGHKGENPAAPEVEEETISIMEMEERPTVAKRPREEPKDKGKAMKSPNPRPTKKPAPKKVAHPVGESANQEGDPEDKERRLLKRRIKVLGYRSLA